MRRLTRLELRAGVQRSIRPLVSSKRLLDRTPLAVAPDGRLRQRVELIAKLVIRFSISTRSEDDIVEGAHASVEPKDFGGKTHGPPRESRLSVRKLAGPKLSSRRLRGAEERSEASKNPGKLCPVWHCRILCRSNTGDKLRSSEVDHASASSPCWTAPRTLGRQFGIRVDLVQMRHHEAWHHRLGDLEIVIILQRADLAQCEQGAVTDAGESSVVPRMGFVPGQLFVG
jgi:hypothetical protein